MAKKRVVGRIVVPGERADYLKIVLMYHYGRNKGFVKGYLWLLYRYERLLEALIRATKRHPDVGAYEREAAAWEALDAAIGSQPVRTPVGQRVSRNTSLRRYRQELIDLCNKWGLACSWAPMWLHACLVNFVALSTIPEDVSRLPIDQQIGLRKAGAPVDFVPRCRFRRFIRRRGGDEGARPTPGDFPYLWPSWVWERARDDDIASWTLQGRRDYLQELAGIASESPRQMIRIEVKADPLYGDTWEYVRKRIMEAARPLWDEMYDLYINQGFLRYDTEPELQRHASWLYMRICPQEGTGKPLGWRRIANKEGVSWFTVRDTVLALAKELEIDLSTPPAGRPRKM
jgi:hypothetical protein